MKELRGIDLFSGGCAGFTLGLERTGKYNAVALVEVDEERQENLRDKFPDKIILGDITKVSYKDGHLIDKSTRPATRYYVGELDYIAGGFPCQDISIAGNKKGFKDDKGKATRSGLWKEYYRLIKEIKPRIVFIENVANLYNIGLAEIITDLARINYVGEGHPISACSVGAFHLRKRIFLIAHPESPRARIDESGLRRQLTGESSKRDGGTMPEIPRPLPDWPFPDTDKIYRLWRPHSGQKASSRWWTKATSRFRNVFLKAFEIEPTVLRGVLRVSKGLDIDTKRQGEAEEIRKRIKAIDREVEGIRRKRIEWIGDSIVPQIPELIGPVVANNLEELK